MSQSGWAFRLLIALVSLGSGATQIQCPEAPVCDCPSATRPRRTLCEEYFSFPVSLRWLKSAQFAGYYAAEANGYWEDECLRVTLMPPNAGILNVDAVWDTDRHARASIPWYMSFLKYAITERRDVMHVSQYFRRSAVRLVSSPVFGTGEIGNMTELNEISDVSYCSSTGARLYGIIFSLFQTMNKTLCNFIHPITKEYVGCTGNEDVEVVLCGFGISEILGTSEDGTTANLMLGMVYDQIGQLLATVSPETGELYREGIDFQVFNPTDEGTYNLEDGIMVNKTWLKDPVNEETLIRFLKGLHRGWIFCRDNPVACVDFVSPRGIDNAMKMHQRYQMHEVNKLIWPSPQGIGVHSESGMVSTQNAALMSGVIEYTVPFVEHTKDMYAMEANARLEKEGYDIFGQYMSQSYFFQRRMPFCINPDGVVEICPLDEGGDKGTPTQNLRLALIAVATFLVVSTAATATAFVFWRKRHAVPYSTRGSSPPGLLPGHEGAPVTIVVTDIEDSSSSWRMYPDSMVTAQEMHDKCLRQAIKECQGYEVHTEGDSFTVAFHDAGDALTWCSMVQKSLQKTKWPSPWASSGASRSRMSEGYESVTSEATSGLFDLNAASCCFTNELDSSFSSYPLPPRQRERAKAGLAEFNGLRVRMGVHCGVQKELRRHPVTNRVVYDKDVTDLANAVCECACGGQVLLTSDVLAELPICDAGKPQWLVLHLGGHIMHLPQLKTSRVVSGSSLMSAPNQASFAAASSSKLASGAADIEMSPMKDAVSGLSENEEGEGAGSDEIHLQVLPDQEEKDVAVDIFMMVPRTLTNRLNHYPPIRSGGQVSPGFFGAPSKDQVTICFSSIYNVEGLLAHEPEEGRLAVDLVCQTLRDELSKIGGYECEENSGDFMVAFSTPEAAMHWATNIQESLLKVEWKPEVLSCQGCEAIALGGSATLMFSGPRVQVGMASGSVLKKIPSTRTGRADYFGPLLNLAARVKGLAAGGQVLADGASWVSVAEYDRQYLQATDLGLNYLKGYDNPVRVYQISQKESALAWRSYPVIPRVDSPDDDEHFEAPVSSQVSPGRKHASDANGEHNANTRLKLHPRGILKIRRISSRATTS